MLFLYSDAASHLNHKIPHKITYGFIPFKGGRSIQVKITKKDKHRTATGWPRPLNRGGRLIQVTNTAFV